MKIAVMYIALGRYDVFFERFHAGCERFFVPEAEKEYFVFTDSKKSIFDGNPAIHKIHREDMGWPGNTLMRFEMFCSVKSHMNRFDKVFFFNANMIFKKTVTADEISGEGLIFVLHPGYWRVKNPDELPYERNETSLAQIPYGSGEVYVCGGVNGGERGAYMRMSGELMSRIKKDKDAGVTALHNDESHINRYLFEAEKGSYRILGPGYVYPERLYIKGVDMKIKLLEKDRFFKVGLNRGGHGAGRDGVVYRLFLYVSIAASGILRFFCRAGRKG